MKIKAFGIFDVEATPSEFVELINRMGDDFIDRISLPKNRRITGVKSKKGAKPAAKQAQLALEVPEELPEVQPEVQAVAEEIARSVNGKPQWNQNMHPVDLINGEGRVVKTYPSVTQASKEAGFKHPSRMTEAIRKKRRFKGFWYAYHE